jgi:pimeloyl-ACP methyl ester carboxylesterase
VQVVFVHGVPETHQVWDRLRGNLSGDDHLALSLPGFGCVLPDRFEPSMESYADWLIVELERQDEPVHLVGHDWGGILVLRAVSLRPDLVASWVTDAAGAADPRFAWHPLAKIWQTPGEGEGWMDAQLSLSDQDRTAALARFGVPEADALVMVEAFDRTMADAILTLYRSAVSVHEDWGADFADIPAPGLVLAPPDDPYAPGRGAERAAERSGARLTRPHGIGHWWMLTNPEAMASLLQEFWSSVA